MPEDWPVFELFQRHSTQWRMSFSGPVGLDYSVIYQWMDRAKIPDEKQLEMIDKVGQIEFGYLDQLREEQDEQKPG